MPASDHMAASRSRLAVRSARFRCGTPPAAPARHPAMNNLPASPVLPDTNTHRQNDLPGAASRREDNGISTVPAVFLLALAPLMSHARANPAGRHLELKISGH
jgi:hypothetical protein